mgnify:CR=1 FL=1
MAIKIPFKVSARTARLIGRENVASSKGAIIELVKNGYDADSNWVIVVIDNSHSIYKNIITPEEFTFLIDHGIGKDILHKVYNLVEGRYIERPNIDKTVRAEYISMISRLGVIYIMDNGEGMTQSIISNYWMTIGTNNKDTNYTTNKGRIKSGAKGIGRFALDKLGSKCEMITFFDPTVHNNIDVNGNLLSPIGYQWFVDWDEFEKETLTIDAIGADLIGLEQPITFGSYINAILQNTGISLDLSTNSISHGTILKISDLREEWSENVIEDLYADLSVLVPPVDFGDFKIILKSTSFPNKYGEIESNICSDYDYKLEAKADDKQNVRICITRKEYDADKIPDEFFSRERMQAEKFQRNMFAGDSWIVNRTFSQLIPGYSEFDNNQILSQIGQFSFTFYFLKRGATTLDEKRFYYRRCAYNLRTEWLNKFGGIKLFRDGFRVRPYGERNDTSFDWLALGARKQKNPAGIAKREGGYRVEVENVAGFIQLSRLTNISFEDKSSREGLQENRVFKVFKTLIQGIIAIFEEDRAMIAREFAAYDEEVNEESNNRARAEELAKIILRNRGNNKHEPTSVDPKDISLEMLARLNEQKTVEIDQLREEQKMLRALASSGLMLASFSHDLSKLNDAITDRYTKLRNLLLERLPETLFQDTPRWKNPYVLIDKAQKNDEKMQSWLSFSIGVVRKDKRKRKNINFLTYFENLHTMWQSVFSSRAIKFDYSHVEEKLMIRAFEIDLDCIFYNLFSNSIESFVLMKEDRKRIISVAVMSDEQGITIEYRDSGSGLSRDIINPEIIFEPFFSTKRDPITGEIIGTGLGMWLLKLTASENNAKVTLLNLPYGFGLKLNIPQNKYK